MGRKIIVYVVFLLAIAATAEMDQALSEKVRFVVLTLILLAYLAYEVREFLKVQTDRGLLSPVVLASAMTFAVAFGLTNILWLLPEQDYPEMILGTEAYRWMSHAMLYVLLAAFAMWQGYHAGIGRRIGAKLWQMPFFRKLLRTRFELRWEFIVFCIVVTLTSRLLQVSLGLYGYNSEVAQLYGLAAYREYLDIAASFGKVALVGCALTLFSRPRNILTHKLLLIGLLAFEVLFGFLSGFKGQVILPVVIVGLCYYAIKGHMPKKVVVGVFALFMLAYVVIEPYRIVRYADPNFQNRDVVNIGSVMVNQVQGEQRADNGVVNDPSQYFANFVSRLNSTPEAARSIQYMDQSGLSVNAPEFLDNLFLVPVHAVVPRMLMPTKPLQNIGLWYANEVLEQDTELNSVAMSPVGYLYFAGGGLLVFLGFFLIGVIQQAVYKRFWLAGSGGLVVLLALSSSLAVIDSSFDSILINLIRNVPLLLASQYFLFKR
ncbi:MAG: hypothetical protein QOD75_878 [Blastocatellia bacterium]|jgi:hypothetical protein|nr:hypothetical protein [Blastocatellia bacterium]